MRSLSNWFGSRKSRPRQVRRAQLGLEQLESRVVPYTASGNAWPHAQLVTLSFVPDGTNLGGVSSNLFATFNAKWATSTWQNQILKAAQVWAQQTNLNFAVVPDDGSPIGAGSFLQGAPNVGDIRIGGYNFGTSTLASAYLPPPVNNYSIAGDVQFNTGQTWNIGTTYDLFTVAAHEIGHALGLLHSSTSTAVMYGAYVSAKSGLSSDDISGVRAVYSGGNPRAQDAYDAAASNNTFSTASVLTGLIDPTTLTALVGNLDLTTTADVDYYTVVAPATTSSTFTVTVQSQGLSLLAPNVTVYASDKTTVLGSASGAGQYGTTLTVTVSNVTAGEQFYVKVSPSATNAFGTGAYALTLDFGTGGSPTVPLPNTQTANGNPLTSGGGQPEKPGTAPENGGHDVFDNSDGAEAKAAAPATPARQPAANRQPELVTVLTAGSGSPTALIPTAVPQAAAPASLGAPTAATAVPALAVLAPLAAVEGSGAAGGADAALPADLPREQGPPPAEWDGPAVRPATEAGESHSAAVLWAPLSDRATEGALSPWACDACFADGRWADAAPAPAEADDACFAELAAAAGLAVALGTPWAGDRKRRRVG